MSVPPCSGCCACMQHLRWSYHRFGSCLPLACQMQDYCNDKLKFKSNLGQHKVINRHPKIDPTRCCLHRLLRIIFYRSSQGGKQDSGKHFLQVILTGIHQQERPQNIQDLDACCMNEGLMVTNYVGKKLSSGGDGTSVFTIFFSFSFSFLPFFHSSPPLLPYPPSCALRRHTTTHPGSASHDTNPYNLGLPYRCCHWFSYRLWHLCLRSRRTGGFLGLPQAPQLRGIHATLHYVGYHPAIVRVPILLGD